MGLDMDLYCSKAGLGMQEAMEADRKMSHEEWMNTPIEERPMISIGYWRKANQVFSWIDKNVGHIENCEPVRFSANDLKNLKQTCQKILDNHDLASKLMPTKEGFFFGSKEYDESYFGQLQDTVYICNRALEETDFYNQDVWFRAWW